MFEYDDEEEEEGFTESNCSSDDGEISGLKKFVDVELPDDFDPNKLPSSGIEYLQYARYEAQKCQAIATADLDTSKFNKISTLTPAFEVLPEVSKLLLPTLQWHNQKLAEFTEFRNYLHSKLGKVPEDIDYKQLEWIEKMDNEYPTFSVVSKFNAFIQLNLLELIVKKLKLTKSGNSISDSMGVWIYSILSVIELPISPNLCSILRMLARECILIRSKLSNEVDPIMFKHLNFFIAIIGIYFKQFDLADFNDKLIN